MMNRFLKESETDELEFVLLPKWDSENPPLTPSDTPSGCSNQHEYHAYCHDDDQ
jgi:hypothetical protein